MKLHSITVILTAAAALLPTYGSWEKRPVAYVWAGEEDADKTPEEYSLILQCLEKKGLISLDFDKPLRGFDESAYAAYPIRGSLALTQRGQTVLELLEYQGIT